MPRNPAVYGAAGHYAVATATGAIAAGMATNGQLLHFRWTSTTQFALINEVLVTGMRATTAFAAGTINMEMVVARAYTAVGSGGTAIEFGGDSNVDNAALRTNMADSAVNDLRIASTAALTAGTQALEANAIGQIITHSSGGVGSATPIIGSLYLPHNVLFKADASSGLYPLVLTKDEGFVIRATVPATGVWNAGFLVRWAEIDTSKF